MEGRAIQSCNRFTAAAWFLAMAAFTSARSSAAQAGATVTAAAATPSMSIRRRAPSNANPGIWESLMVRAESGERQRHSECLVEAVQPRRRETGDGVADL